MVGLLGSRLVGLLRFLWLLRLRGRRLHGVRERLTSKRAWPRDREHRQIVKHGPIAERDAEAFERDDHQRVRLTLARDVEPVVRKPERRDVIVPRIEELIAVRATRRLLY